MPRKEIDMVDIVARRIHYDLIGDELHTSTSDFQIVEPDQPVPDSTSPEPHLVSVEFAADVPASVVVHALRTMLDTLEKDGVPKLVTKMERADANSFMQLQKDAVKISKRVAKMRPELLDAFYRITKQQGHSWGDEIALTKITKISIPD